MLLRFLAGFTFLIAQNVIAAQFPLVLTESFNDTKVVIYTNENDIRNAPNWQPSDGAPPLSVENLITDVQEWNRLNPKLSNATINEFELKPINHYKNENRWYYLVQMKNKSKGKKGEHYLAVLMDGKVLPAIIEPVSYK
ncbi:hypothetical protein MNBD_GAMMA25-1352 [hydrothermal vent metagenome]|uniref:Uncharacterized protein n=1 Tax=hydrothermal vent metagenome TaxID=652676 RepID=A0A3B1AV23_9ZZZZ